MLTLCKVPKVKVVFPVLVSGFHSVQFNSFKSVAAILEKGLLEKICAEKMRKWNPYLKGCYFLPSGPNDDLSEDLIKSHNSTIQIFCDVIIQVIYTFSISIRFPSNMHGTRPWWCTGAAPISGRQVHCAVLSRRDHRDPNRHSLIFPLTLILLHSTHRHDALGAGYKPGNQAMSMDRNSVETWEPIGDECVHVFHSDGDKASGRLNVTVCHSLHFETNQLWSFPVVCGNNWDENRV